MKSIKITHEVQSKLAALLQSLPLIMQIVQAIHEQGGRALLVGGAVRDLLLDREVKDLDVEIHGLSHDALEALFQTFGPVSLVGKVFGVFRLHGLDVDWSLPRSDSGGRKPEVKVDPFMQMKDAFVRRDLTINAMGIDCVTHELIDPFGGYEDLRAGILRSPDVQFFTEDPLRFYRVMQFISRFEMQPDQALNKVCATMSVATVSVERIETEFDKLMLRSMRPSLGIRWLQSLGRLPEVLPELADTVGIVQDARWHPEGDVFEHTMQTLDASVKDLKILYAALCHDLGKVSTTEEKDEKITSHGHAEEGKKLSVSMMKRITHRKELIEAVAKLVRYHMMPVQFVADGAKPSAYKRLARKLAPHATLQMLADLAQADKKGRNANGPQPLTDDDPAIVEFLRRAESAQVRIQVEEPLLLGRDVMDVVKPGPRMGKLLEAAYEMQIEHGIQDRDELKRRVLKDHFKKDVKI